MIVSIYEDWSVAPWVDLSHKWLKVMNWDWRVDNLYFHKWKLLNKSQDEWLHDLKYIFDKMVELRSAYDGTSRLKDSIKEPIRKRINIARSIVDGEFEKLYDSMLDMYGEDSVNSILWL